MRAVAYLRVSTDAQAEADRNSLPLQEKAVRARAAEHGYELGEVFTDVMSGRKVARPAYQRMLAGARAGAFDVILVTWLDRFGRNDREITMRVLELQDAGVQVEPTEEQIPDFITLVLTAWKAGQEVQRITDRTSDGLLEAARRGVAIGRAPYGYRQRWEHDPSGKKVNIRFEVYEPEAERVRWIFEQYATSNMSTRAICSALNVVSPRPNGGLWQHVVIEKIIRRRRYVGEYTYSARANGRREAVEVVVQMPEARIVTDELFAAANARMDVKAAMPKGRTQSSTYLLSGLLRCGGCGGTMSARRQPQHRNGKVFEYPTYYCRTYLFAGRQCESGSGVQQHFIDDAVLSYLEDVAVNVAAMRNQIGERSTAAHIDLLKVKRGIADLDAEFEKNMRLFRSGAIASEDQFARANRMLDQDKRRLEAEQTRLLDVIAATAARQREVGELPEQIPALFDRSLPIGERKAIVQRYIARVVVPVRSRVPVIYPRFME